MTPLIFAAAVALSPAVAQPTQASDAPVITTKVMPARDPVEVATAACAKLGIQTVAPDGVPFWKLGDLPPPVQEHAVWRTVAGCPVREVVYQGQRYYLGSSIPRMQSGPDTGSRLSRRDYRAEPTPAPNHR